MTSVPPLINPSPARNPFARPCPNHQSTSFTRTSLLPTLPPTPIHKSIHQPSSSSHNTPHQHVSTTSATRALKAWRLLYRGGLEIGLEGFRLDGITFFARLSFPSTPSHQSSNTFDSLTPHVQSSHMGEAAFAMTTDTDLCLSLESMRGRKYLQMRGVVDLLDDEVLDGESAGVQVAVAPEAPLLSAYLTGILCRTTLSSGGRTKSAIVVGLGDEGSGEFHPSASSILIYGQLQENVDSNTLRLCVARRKPPPAPAVERKIRPGEPLPRAPLFFPSKAPRKPPPPFPRRSGSVTFSRAPSVSSIYAPPPPPPPLPPAPIPGRTPGRRGEKRLRPFDPDEDDRKRKQGRIIPHLIPLISSSSSLKTLVSPPVNESLQVLGDDSKVKVEEEDIFGKRPVVRPGEEEPSSAGKNKRRVPQQVLDNKAGIRKQTLVLLESRGISRDHENFKEVFSMTTKGVYFVFRDNLDGPALPKGVVQDIVKRHLDMYLAPPDLLDTFPFREAEQSDGNPPSTPLVKIEEEFENKNRVIKIEREEVLAFDSGAWLNEVRRRRERMLHQSDHLEGLGKDEGDSDKEGSGGSRRRGSYAI
ncbi:hypothetical protein M231_00141 [Tremella mesenterica]|uniref:Sld7 C-terminal domain-containing protein n=1 Tax=Tremella mesenterica TaxID=5217 RepID=A0A4V1M545_TREME|nr:hypothetical protein M231_00141 [Tremella mesenterica]